MLESENFHVLGGSHLEEKTSWAFLKLRFNIISTGFAQFFNNWLLLNDFAITRWKLFFYWRFRWPNLGDGKRRPSFFSYKCALRVIWSERNKRTTMFSLDGYLTSPISTLSWTYPQHQHGSLPPYQVHKKSRDLGLMHLRKASSTSV